jgi:hypothetical protein
MGNSGGCHQQAEEISQFEHLIIDTEAVHSGYIWQAEELEFEDSIVDTIRTEAVHTVCSLQAGEQIQVGNYIMDGISIEATLKHYFGEFGNNIIERSSTEDSGPDSEFSLGSFEPVGRYEAAKNEDDLPPDLFYDVERAQMVRDLLGLNSSAVASFLNEVECLSIGTFCGTSNALECLGLRKCAYPFDWLRSPIEGVMHCLETRFQNFLDYTNVRYEGEHKVFETCWGGSFWHHDIESADIKEQLQRRCKRFLGDGDVPCTAPRMFVRVANTSEEVSMATELFAKLQACFPRAQVYLLMILDMQKQARFIRVKSMNRNILFCLVNEELWLRAGLGVTQQMHNCGDSYASCVAAAIGYWATQRGNPAPEVLRDSAALESIVQNYHGGNCLNAGYMPDPTKVEYYLVPDDQKGGDVVLIFAFGEETNVRIPDGAKAGDSLELRLDRDGQFHVSLITIDSSANSPYFQRFPSWITPLEKFQDWVGSTLRIG